MIIDIDQAGTLTFIHDDRLVEIIEEGQATLRRVSHVEPAEGGGWTADMSPVGGPVLGPFRLRGEALAAEVAWLESNVFA